MQYPIDIEATKGKWVIYDKTAKTHSRMGGNGNWPNGDGTEIVGLDANLVPLLRVADTTPSFDPSLEAVVSSDVIDLTSNELRSTFVVSALSGESLAVTQADKAADDAHAAASAAFESLPKGKQALWESVRVGVSAALMVGDFATAKEILLTTPLIYDGADADRDSFLALFP